MSASASAPEFEAVEDQSLRQRLLRHSRLRAARRAVARALPVNEPGREQAAALRARLEEFAARSSGGEAVSREELASADAEIARQARSLRSATARIEIAQLRATLPASVRDNREEVLALADLLVEDEAEISLALPALDYLLTLLASRQVGGLREVHWDPAELTPLIAECCTRIGAQFKRDRDMGAAGALLYKAAALDADLETRNRQLREMRALKRKLGVRVLAPELLRATVTYNASVWNHLEAELQEERRTDWVRDDAPLAGAAPVPASDAEAIEAAPVESCTIFQSKAMDSIARALRARIHGDMLGESLADRIAVRADLTALGDRDRKSVAELVRTEQGNAPSPVALAIALGLTIRLVPVAADQLQELGIDTCTLQTTWLEQADAALKVLVNEQLAGQHYDDACALTETRTKFLYELISTNRREERASTAPTASKASPSAGAANVEHSEATRPPAARPRQKRRAVEVQRPKEASSLDGFFAPVAALLAVAAVLVLGFNLIGLVGGAQSTVHHFDQTVLQIVSPVLESGYRDREGMGPLFAGRLGPAWDRMDKAGRAEQARAIVAEMTSRGVRDVMLYDRNRHLEVLFAGGSFRLPRGLANQGRR